MKGFLVAVLLVMCMVFFPACEDNSNPTDYVLDRDTSYALGMFMADFITNQFGFPYMRFDYDAFRDGFKAYNEETETRLSYQDMMDKLNSLIMMIEAQEYEEFFLEGEANLVAGLDYQAQNRTRPGVNVTASGLQWEVIVEGTGNRPGYFDDVLVHYEGTFIDGGLFDSSYIRGEPLPLNLSMVIPGWSEGVQLMPVGSTYRFVIPSHLAYDQGFPGEFPANATLIFMVELLEILPPQN